MTRLISLFKDAHNGTYTPAPSRYAESLRDQPAYFVELMRYLEERRTARQADLEEKILIGAEVRDDV